MEENHEDELSVFTPPLTNTGVHTRKWIEYRPTNQISGESPLEFLIPPQSVGYMDLRRSTLKIKLRFTNALGQPVAKDANLPLQAVFSQVDCSLQQTSVTQTGTNYPYKAYIDTLLETGANDRVLRDSQLFEKDSPRYHDDVRNGANIGLYTRSMYTDEGLLLELEVPLHLDVFRPKRLIINRVSLTMKLWPSKNAFRLISGEKGSASAVQILDAGFKLCLQKPNAGVLMAHSKLLANGTAMYQYVSTSFKIASLSKGEYIHSESNLFQGDVPSQLIVGLVSSEAFSGNYKKSPFNFQRSTVIFWPCTSTDNRTRPNRYNPTSPNKNYVEAYRTLSVFGNDVDVSYAAYGGGYAIYVLNVDDDVDFNTKRREDCRLEIRFGTALPESVRVLMYGKFPRIVHVDQSRSVLLQ